MIGKTPIYILLTGCNYYLMIMLGANRAKLRQLLVVTYDDLKLRLGRYLGSDALASEALHETYLKLDREDDIAVLRQPEAYLFRTALNVGRDRQRAEARKLDDDDVKAIFAWAQEGIDTTPLLEARSEIGRLQQAMNELSSRQRQILLAVRLEGASHAEMAQKFKISERMIDKELRTALEFCADRLGRDLVTRFGLRRFKPAND